MFSLTVLWLAFFSCGQKNAGDKPENPDEIISISYSDIGGESGNYKIVKVTKDSIHLEQGVTRKKIHTQWKSALTPQDWKRLTAAIDIRTLDRIRSSPSKQSVDGFDETFQIRTPKKYHAYVNSYADTTYYRQLQMLKDRIQAILPTEYN